MSFLVDIGFVVGPVLGYVAQYRLIKETKTVGSFSTDVCAILLAANVLRIYFWFGKQYETPLLIQSFLMIAAQLVLLRACVYFNKIENVNHRSPKKPGDKNFDVDEIEKNPFTSKFWNRAWRWQEFESYVYSVLLFTISAGLLTATFIRSPIFVELIGLASAMIEAALGMPQFLKNYKSKRTAGISYALIMSWFGGDLFKTIYFVTNDSPMQFLMCGVTQLTVDVLIIAQIYLYKEKNQYKPVNHEVEDQ